MAYSYAEACKALGVGSSTYARMLSGDSKIDLRTALACSALASGLSPWPCGQLDSRDAQAPAHQDDTQAPTGPTPHHP